MIAIRRFSSLLTAQGIYATDPPAAETDLSEPGAEALRVEVARAGLEPATPRFSAVCSTN